MNERSTTDALVELLNDIVGRSPSGTISVKAPSLALVVRVIQRAGVEHRIKASGLNLRCPTCQHEDDDRDGSCLHPTSERTDCGCADEFHAAALTDGKRGTNG